MNSKTNPKPKGFTLVEAVIATVAIAVLIVIFAPAFRPHRGQVRTSRIGCVNNEKQLGIALRGFGIDMGAFPMQLADTNAPVTQPPQ